MRTSLAIFLCGTYLLSAEVPNIRRATSNQCVFDGITVEKYSTLALSGQRMLSENSLTVSLKNTSSPIEDRYNMIAKPNVIICSSQK